MKNLLDTSWNQQDNDFTEQEQALLKDLVRIIIKDLFQKENV